jgi:SAM-dependent methyltransferase
MEKYQFLVAILLVSLATFFIIYRLYHRPQSWEKYYQEHINKPVRPLLLKAFKGLQPTTGTALDLGAGNGHETLYLLACSWQVYAIDAQPAAKK